MGNLHAVDLIVTIDGEVAAALCGVTVGDALTGEALFNTAASREDIASFMLVFACEALEHSPAIRHEIEAVLDKMGVHDHTNGDVADGLTGRPSAN